MGNESHYTVRGKKCIYRYNQNKEHAIALFLKNRIWEVDSFSIFHKNACRQKNFNVKSDVRHHVENTLEEETLIQACVKST